MANTQECILIIGAGGQLGSELTFALRQQFGDSQVVAADLKPPQSTYTLTEGPFATLDVLDKGRLRELAEQYRFTQIYHLAAVLSAVGEQNPQLAWHINMEGLLNVLETAVEQKVGKVFWPSSIAVFGPHTPPIQTPQYTTMDPTTVYGISKQAGERWCAYYHARHQLDVRSLRYPGLVGYKSLPGGGTTDYAVDIYHKALEGLPFTCYLNPDTALPMMYMPDAIRATLELMDAPADRIRIRSSYNVAAMSFTPADIARSIQRSLPDFRIDYRPDYRQQIAETWPRSIDDAEARRDWGWLPAYDLDTMTADMLAHLKSQKEQSAA
jgi:nucleoside-diphosphate-sugar epimerase